MTPPSPPPKRSQRRRRLRALLAFFALFFALLIISYFSLRVYYDHKADKRLQAAIAEADRTDPGWRLEDILAEINANPIPDEENSALVVMKIHERLPKHWPMHKPAPVVDDTARSWMEPTEPEPDAANWETYWEYYPRDTVRSRWDPEVEPYLEELLEDIPDNQTLNDWLFRALQAELDAVAGPLNDARTLAEMPRGRHPPLNLKENPELMMVAHNLDIIQQKRLAAKLLTHDIRRLIHQGDLDAGLVSCHAIVNVGRSLADEPTLIAGLVRMALHGVAGSSIQRVLAHGEPSEEALSRLQKALEREASEPMLWKYLRGDRACTFHDLEVLRRRPEKVSAADTFEFVAKLHSEGRRPPRYRLWAEIHPDAYIRFSQAVTLDLTTRAVQIARLPAAERYRRFLELRQEWENALDTNSIPGIALALRPADERVSQAFHRLQADLHCAILAIAAERYRRTHDGRWPETIEQLTGLVPSEMLIDPFSGEMIRMARRDDGLVVYSVGRNLTDEGGNLERINVEPYLLDIGFRLYDVAHRRKPPPFPDRMLPAEPEPNE